MKKIFLFSSLIMSIFVTVQAGFLIQGISITLPSEDLKNYTLTFRDDGTPISAASMHSSIYGSGIGKNSIIIIQSDVSGAYIFPIAPLSAPNIPNDIEVRDFWYDKRNEVYVLCGSRRSSLGTRAFVAVIDDLFSAMQFQEYPEANVFYSICNPNMPTVSSNYYVCGKSGDRGVIASVHRGTLHFTNFHVTDIPWEYHKIFANPLGAGTPLSPLFVVSGRDPRCSQIGFTVLNAMFTQINSYRWAQTTDPQSHCVVSDEGLGIRSVILASSYQNIVTLFPITYPITPATVRAHRFHLPMVSRYYVQDIGTIRFDANNFRISVAGFERGSTIQTKAWHGYVTGLSGNMTNNDYFDFPIGNYEHYKIRYQETAPLVYKEYTGGYFERIGEMGALFGSPLTPSITCDHHYYSTYLEYQDIIWHQFILASSAPTPIPYTPSLIHHYDMDFEHICDILKGGDSAPELTIPAEDESEIITYYDRITVKDIPMNTNYQIYNVVGQLVQVSTANPDISTSSLKRGIYILRLENGKAFKFVR